MLFVLLASIGGTCALVSLAYFLELLTDYLSRKFDQYEQMEFEKLYEETEHRKERR